MTERVAPTTRHRRSTAEMLAVLNREHGLEVRYQRFQRAVISALIPAHRAADGRSWEFDPADEAKIVAYFRAAEPTPLPRPKPRPRPSAPLPPAA